MIKIVFLCDWGQSPAELLERYKYQTPKHDGVWGSIKGITDISKADYYIILDGYPKYKTLDPKKKIYLQREPPAIKSSHGFDSDDALYIGNYTKHYHVATWMIKKPFNTLWETGIPDKPYLLSSVTSNKSRTAGQKQRLTAIRKIQQKTSLVLYGKGFKPLTQNSYCKWAGLAPFKYSFACENSQLNNYFTEKIIDCFLTWTKPLYWGCPNIGRFFPKDSYELIDIYGSDIERQVQAAIEKPVNYEALRQARDLVLNKYNLWPSIERIIKEVQ